LKIKKDKPIGKKKFELIKIKLPNLKNNNMEDKNNIESHKYNNLFFKLLLLMSKLKKYVTIITE